LYLERDLEARRKVKSAMVYPSIVAMMSMGTVVVLAVFVLPKFKDFFASLDAKLPLPTRLLLAMTAFLGTWWWVIAAGLVAVAAGYVLGLRTTTGRRLRDATLLRAPVLGATIRFAVVERFTRLLASMMA